MTRTTAPRDALVVDAEPTRKVGGVWIAGFSIAWLGVWMAQLTPVQLLLPVQVDALIATDTWQDSVMAFGIVSGISSVFAIISYPLTGALSDRTTSRFGRRRPWILGGALLFAGALLALSVQETIVGVAVFWSIAITGFCALSAALTATISDQVPVGQRGLVSGFISAPQAVGIIVGLVLVTELFIGALLGYTALAVALLVLVVPFLFVRDAVLPQGVSAPLTLRTLIAGFWISPRAFPDFGWTLGSRVLVNIGNALGTSLLLFFLIYGLGRPALDAEGDLLLLTLVYMVASIIASIVCGRWSDVLGRRKVFVLSSALLQASGAVLLIVWPQFEIVMIGALLLGLGYGCFLSVDQALATQVLPDATSRGKDLGIMNIASAVPQALAPMLGALVVSAVGGFEGLFVASAVFSTAGALMILGVKGVR
ncbi:MFS transporter [Microcella pacifica]|uniref:MFS transporter n=1 Tax=Microcella pacifica TaxID=2591847 RepID=A0A9E5MKZ9_9MICO|nr:MFS transporter [Microcella pacifica]NHF63271.1 MFS transporter [Microcella pacifica]